MRSDNKPSTNDADITWPSAPSGILIMGKRQGTKAVNKQLWGRIAMAAALWYSAPYPKPYILFVASDVPRAAARPDAETVKLMLVNTFGISADYVIARRASNCTLIEVRVARILRRVYNLEYIFAVTHLYHAPRTQRYLDEVLPNAFVIPVHPAILSEIKFPPEQTELWIKIQDYVADSLPGPFDLRREQVIEGLLSLTHTVGPRGKLERLLARVLRPTVRTG